MSETECLSQLAAQVRLLSRATSPAHVFKSLLEAARSCVPRAAVFLVSQGKIQGWGSIGYSAEAAGVQRTYHASANSGWLGWLVTQADEGPSVRPETDSDPAFGQAAASEVLAYCLLIDGRPIGLLVGERSSNESPWNPDGMGILTSVARNRLELAMLRRRPASARPGVEVRPEEPSAADCVDGGGAAVEAPTPTLEAARRYARLVATDIRLYNEEAVKLGRMNGDLSERLGEHLGRGRDTFLRRHGELGPAGIELLHEAFVQVLAAGNAELIPLRTLD